MKESELRELHTELDKASEKAVVTMTALTDVAKKGKLGEYR